MDDSADYEYAHRKLNDLLGRTLRSSGIARVAWAQLGITSECVNLSAFDPVAETNWTSMLSRGVAFGVTLDELLALQHVLGGRRFGTKVRP